MKKQVTSRWSLFIQPKESVVYMKLSVSCTHLQPISGFFPVTLYMYTLEGIC